MNEYPYSWCEAALAPKTIKSPYTGPVIWDEIYVDWVRAHPNETPPKSLDDIPRGGVANQNSRLTNA